jgi:hypothetical protein
LSKAYGILRESFCNTGPSYASLWRCGEISILQTKETMTTWISLLSNVNYIKNKKSNSRPEIKTKISEYLCFTYGFLLL